jgi:hypothetical protein
MAEVRHYPGAPTTISFEPSDFKDYSITRRKGRARPRLSMAPEKGGR